MVRNVHDIVENIQYWLSVLTLYDALIFTHSTYILSDSFVFFLQIV
jgi:hypothetical protein